MTLIFFLVQCECFSMNIWSGNFWAKRRGSRPKRAQNSYKPPIKIFIHLSIKEILGSMLAKEFQTPPMMIFVQNSNDHHMQYINWFVLKSTLKEILFLCKKSSYHFFVPLSSIVKEFWKVSEIKKLFSRNKFKGMPALGGGLVKLCQQLNQSPGLRPGKIHT